MRLAPGCSQFAAWFQRAAGAGVGAPEAAALATASTDGVPSVRMVLMKQYDEARIRVLLELRKPQG